VQHRRSSLCKVAAITLIPHQTYLLLSAVDHESLTTIDARGTAMPIREQFWLGRFELGEATVTSSEVAIVASWLHRAALLLI